MSGDSGGGGCFVALLLLMAVCLFGWITQSSCERIGLKPYSLFICVDDSNFLRGAAVK